MVANAFEVAGQPAEDLAITSPEGPSGSWRPADAAPADPALTGLAARLAAMIEAARADGIGDVSITLDWSEASVSAVVALGGAVERSFWTWGYYLAARLEVNVGEIGEAGWRRVTVSALGPYVSGPMTRDEVKAHARHSDYHKALSEGYEALEGVAVSTVVS